MAAGQKPVKVDFPTTRRLADAGVLDLCRAVHSDPVTKPAYPWTPR